MISGTELLILSVDQVFPCISGIKGSRDQWFKRTRAQEDKGSRESEIRRILPSLDLSTTWPLDH